MDTNKALGFVEIAQNEIRKLYLASKATDEAAVATTEVPAHLLPILQALHAATECLKADWTPWEDQAVAVAGDGFVRLKQVVV